MKPQKLFKKICVIQFVSLVGSSHLHWVHKTQAIYLDKVSGRETFVLIKRVISRLAINLASYLINFISRDRGNPLENLIINTNPNISRDFHLLKGNFSISYSSIAWSIINSQLLNILE